MNWLKQCVCNNEGCVDCGGTGKNMSLSLFQSGDKCQVCGGTGRCRYCNSPFVPPLSVVFRDLKKWIRERWDAKSLRP